MFLLLLGLLFFGYSKVPTYLPTFLELLRCYWGQSHDWSRASETNPEFMGKQNNIMKIVNITIPTKMKSSDRLDILRDKA